MVLRAIPATLWLAAALSALALAGTGAWAATAKSAFPIAPSAPAATAPLVQTAAAKPAANDGTVDDDAVDSGDAGDSGDTNADTSSSGDDLGSGDDTGGSGDDLDSLPSAAAPDTATPDVGPPADIRPGSYTLEARLAPKGPPLGDGVKWRIFGDTPGPDGHLELLGQADGGIVYFGLNPGTYYVHAAYGRAGATRKIEVAGRTGGEVVVLNAGGVRLVAINGKDEPLKAGEVTFDIYAPDEAGSEERFLLVPNAPPGHVISLNAGLYHVVSKFGDGNAIVRADIKVDPGKLTEATLFQKAARLTLKLVEQHGGEAIADTAWTVTTLSGARIAGSVGAFPTVILAAGDYTAIAKHDGHTFQKNFTVEAGADRDIEVIAE